MLQTNQVFYDYTESDNGTDDSISVTVFDNGTSDITIYGNNTSVRISDIDPEKLLDIANMLQAAAAAAN